MFFSEFCMMQNNINMKRGIIYVSPEVEIYELLVEGVLCSSENEDSGMDLIPEEGNM